MIARLLITGFGPFADVERNPSEIVCRELGAGLAEDPRIEAYAELLPVEFKAAGERVDALIRERRPDLVLGFGVARRETRFVRLESTARNRNESETTDNAGEMRSGTPIIAGAPAALTTTLPLAELAETLEARGIAVRVSDDADGFVCNHVYYRAQFAASRVGAAACFIHLPNQEPSAEMIAALADCTSILGNRALVARRSSS